MSYLKSVIEGATGSRVGESMATGDYRITRKKNEKSSREKNTISRKKTRNIIKCILLMVRSMARIDSYPVL